MYDYRRILDLKFVNGLGDRDIGTDVGCGKTTVSEFLARFAKSKEVFYPLPKDMTNERLYEIFYKPRGGAAADSDELYVMPDFDGIIRAMTKKGETLKRLWWQYSRIEPPEGKRNYSYRQFCQKVSDKIAAGLVTCHIPRYPGVNLEVDYAGMQLQIHDRKDRNHIENVTVYVATMSYSEYFYAEGLVECKIPQWIGVNNNALHYFGGVPQTVTPDNCKVCVTRNTDWIEPVLNKDFQEWAAHNGTALLPAKPKSPRWKPNVEGTVRIVTEHILKEMQEMTFFSLEELNEELWERMDVENSKPLTGLGISRRDRFEKEEKETLSPLPSENYQYLEREEVKVNKDFCFVFDKVHYSMPGKFLGKTLLVKASVDNVYVCDAAGDVVKTHKRSYLGHGWVIDPGDIPKNYSEYTQWNAPFFQKWASDIGPETRLSIDRILGGVQYPVQAFRTCFGVLALSRKYGKKALEDCCADAVAHGHVSYGYIKNTIPSFVPERQESCQEAPLVIPASRYKADDRMFTLSHMTGAKEGKDNG